MEKLDSRYIKELLDKYYLAETTKEEERYLKDYFKQININEEFIRDALLFKQIEYDKQVKAPTYILDKLKIIQTKSTKKTYYYIFFISTAIAASLLIFLAIGFFNQKTDTDDFVMYKNGERITDPDIAVNFVNQQLSMVSESLYKANDLINNPIDMVNESLKPLYEAKKQLNKFINFDF